MSYTKYGEYIRILRIKYHEVMGDLANVLDTSLPFMSAVENGKKNVPSAWIPKIIEHLVKKELQHFNLLGHLKIWMMKQLEVLWKY